jgi:hypothetical protein
LLLQALFMTAKALTAAKTTKVRTNIKGLFIVTSLRRGPPVSVEFSPDCTQVADLVGELGGIGYQSPCLFVFGARRWRAGG